MQGRTIITDGITTTITITIITTTANLAAYLPVEQAKRASSDI
jgi:hypothetical protein